MGKPSYLPLLNTIAVNEKKGELFLSAWADTTSDRDLAAALRFVAIREGEHAWAFSKRICELGFSSRRAPVPRRKCAVSLGSVRAPSGSRSSVSLREASSSWLLSRSSADRRPCSGGLL